MLFIYYINMNNISLSYDITPEQIQNLSQKLYQQQLYQKELETQIYQQNLDNKNLFDKYQKQKEENLKKKKLLDEYNNLECKETIKEDDNINTNIYKFKKNVEGYLNKDNKYANIKNIENVTNQEELNYILNLKLISAIDTIHNYNLIKLLIENISEKLDYYVCEDMIKSQIRDMLYISIQQNRLEMKKKCIYCNNYISYTNTTNLCGNFICKKNFKKEFIKQQNS